MTLDEAIKHAEEVAEEHTKYNIYGGFESCDKCAKEHIQLAEWLKDYKRLKEQELCEDEYIKVPKKALKYRTAGMVVYNAEWLKNHFDIERAVICGAQEPCEDAISREDALMCLTGEIKETDTIETIIARFGRRIRKLSSVKPQELCGDTISRQAVLDLCDSKDPNYKVIHFKEDVECLPSVNPQPKTGHWTRELIRNEKGGCIGAKMICSECGNDNKHDEYMNCCPNCGAKMIEQQERSDKK